VKKDGTIDYVHIIRDLGAGLGDEVERLLAGMNNKGKWTPAMKDGKPVNFTMTLPVIFKLRGEDIKAEIEKSNLDRAVNPLSEIVVVALSEAASKSKKTEKEIKLNNAKNPLDEVIVVGYGETNKVKDEVKFEEKNGKTDNPLIEKVVIGHPEKSSKFNLNSIENVDYVVVLDGKIMGRTDGKEILNQIDPSTIESITILKGDKAVEKYGSKGKNGVMIITTKLMLKGRPDKISDTFDPGKPILVVLNGNIIGRADGSRNLKHVDPSNIESIIKMKGQEAIEKYGLEGKYGVAEVTTKVPIWMQKSKELKLSNFNLFPNPASNEFRVNFQGPPGDYKLEVTDIKGATLARKEVYNHDQSKVTMDISNLNTGLYYLRILSDQKVATKTFVKE